jgi:hypothetical protein
MASPRESFVEVLRPLAAALEGMKLEDTARATAEIERRAPFSGELVRAVRDAAVQGMQAGWLVPKEQGGIRFGRAAKDLHGFTVDAVQMAVAGPRHRHGQGEIDLCFALSGDPRFDGNPEGWVVFAPGSVHVPTVAGGEMLILYFLPGGAIEFLT